MKKNKILSSDLKFLIKKKKSVNTFFKRNPAISQTIAADIISKKFYELSFQQFANVYAVNAIIQTESARSAKDYLAELYVNGIIAAIRDNKKGICEDALEFVKFRSLENMKLVRAYCRNISKKTIDSIKDTN